MPSRPKIIDIPEARRQVNLGGLTWAAWRHRVKPADLEAALLHANATGAQTVTLPLPPVAPPAPPELEPLLDLVQSRPAPEPEPEPAPAPEPQIEPGREWAPPPDRRTAPARPARMHTRMPSRPAVDLPAPPPPSPPGRLGAPPGAPRFTRHERVQVLATIERHQPISRTLLLNWHTGMRLSTLDAILADLTATDRAVLTDGKYRIPRSHP